jgi:hypothetical protein
VRILTAVLLPALHSLVETPSGNPWGVKRGFRDPAGTPWDFAFFRELSPGFREGESTRVLQI